MHIFGFDLLFHFAVMHRVAAAAAAGFAVVASGGALDAGATGASGGLDGVVAGEGVVDVAEDAEAERVDHRDVVDYDGDEGFTDGPGAGLLGAVDRIL